MIKGINKNMVVVKNTGSRYFEEAHFIVKSGASVRSERDLLREADRLVGAALTREGKGSKPKKRLPVIISVILSFILGALSGIGLCLLL